MSQVVKDRMWTWQLNCFRTGLLNFILSWKKWLKNHTAKIAGGIFKLIHDWFDLFNSKFKYEGDKIPAYGLNLKRQDSIIHDMDEFIKDLRLGNHTGLIEFQKGILRNNESLKSLFHYLKAKYSGYFKVDYILTRRLNQNILENLFFFLRAMGGPNDHPSDLNFKYRIRSFILGKHSNDLFSMGMNTQACNDNEKLVDLDEIISGNFFHNFNVQSNYDDEEEEAEEDEGSRGDKDKDCHLDLEPSQNKRRRYEKIEEVQNEQDLNIETSQVILS